MPRHAEGNHAHRAGALALALALAAVLAGCEKWQLDAQVRELCARDGGMKIYETVALPADQFDRWGMVKFYRPTGGEEALGQVYVFEHRTTYYRRGNPQVSRDHYRIVRRADGMLLGETTLYGRSGGDLPGPWYDSGFSCPENDVAGPNPLIRAVLVPESGGPLK